MHTAIQNKLDAQFDSYRIGEKLHDVPPHEVYEVTVDGTRAVCKANTGPTGNAGVEGRVTAVVNEETAVPVPEVLQVGTDYFVAAFHPEAPAPDKTQQVDDSWAAATGRGLARLHDETADYFDGYGQCRADGDRVTTTGYDEFHDAALEYVRRYRPTLDRYGHADVADDVIDALRANPDAFTGVGEAVLCHGWASPEHVSIVDGELACLLDFEHAIVAPAEFDFWRTADPAFERDSQLERFREGYESVRSLPRRFEARHPLWRILNVIYFFVSLYVQDQHDATETERRAQHLRELVMESIEQTELR